jgi:tetratricopeptide (TPR) repeat protein
MSFSRISSIIVMIFIVGVFCFVAMPKNIGDAFACWIYESKMCKTIESTASAKVVSTPPLAEVKPMTQADVATIAKMTIESVDGKYASLKESQDRLFSIIAALGALMTFLGFKGFDSFFKSKEQADAAAKKAEEVKKFLDEQYEIDNRAEFMVIEAATLRNDADLYANIKQKPSNELLCDSYYRTLLVNAKKYLEAAIELDSKNTLVHIRALGVLGNVYYRFGDYRQAKDCVVKVIKLAEKKGHSGSGNVIDAHFNCACYATKMAASLHLTGEAEKIKEAVELGKEALKKLREYLIYEDIDDVNSDSDLEFLRIHMKAEFDAVIAEKKKSTA